MGPEATATESNAMNDMERAIRSAAVDAIEITPEGAARRHFRFPLEFKGFSGHFPGDPVLPALIQIMAAKTVAEDWKGRPLSVVSVERAKFHMRLRPNQEILIQCRDRTADGNPACEIRLEVAEGLAAAFVMTFSRKE